MPNSTVHIADLFSECEKAESDKEKKPIVTLLKGAIHRDLGNKNVAKQVGIAENYSMPLFDSREL